jgi:hypothetical protein
VINGAKATFSSIAADFGLETEQAADLVPAEAAS